MRASSVIKGLTVSAATAVCAFLSAWTLANDETALGSGVVTHMPEDVRGSVSKIVILATQGRSGEAVTGTYDKKTAGFLGGMAEGSEIGHIPVEVAKVPINIPIPILRELGMIAGAVSGGTQRQIQDFRDRLTEDLKDAVDQPLTNDSLANDVYWGLRRVQTLQPKLFATTTPIPEDTEAVLYVAITELGINVQEDVAIIATKAIARLERYDDGVTLFRKEIRYEDRDTLSNWTRKNTVHWREYRNFARHYIGREISAVLFERVDVEHTLSPRETKSVKRVKKNDWQGKTKMLSPELAWNSELQDAGMDPATVTWDIEIYDRQRPVYTAGRISGTSHTPDVPLEACGDYYWTVRPSYVVDGQRKIGRWMRQQPDGGASNGNAGRAVSVAHAYIQDMARFKVDCRAR